MAELKSMRSIGEDFYVKKVDAESKTVRKDVNGNVKRYDNQGRIVIDVAEQPLKYLAVTTVGVEEGKWVSTLPVDHGYAWFILIAYALIGYFGMGMLRANGIFYVQFMKYFNSPPGSTAWITTVLFGVAVSGGGFLAPVFGVRRVVFAGGLLMSSSLIFSSFVTKVEHLFGTITVLYGFGFALLFTPSIGHTQLYFNKRRGIANGLGTAASSLGSLVAAPLVTYLVDIYGLRGTLLLTGGLSANLLVGAMLLRPAEFYRLKWVPKQGMDNNGFIVGSEEVHSSASKTEVRTENLSPLNGTKSEDGSGKISENLGNGTPNCAKVENGTRKIGVCSENGNSNNASLDDGSRRMSTDSKRRKFSIDVLENDGSEHPNPACCGREYSRSMKFMSSPEFYFHVFSMVLVYWGLNNINVILIPVYAKERGFSDYQGAFLVSIHAGADLCGRLFFGWFIDRRFVPMPLLFAVNMLIISLITSIYPLVAGIYYSAGVTIAFLGFFMGIVHTGNFMLLADKVGIEVLYRALGMMFLIISVPLMFLMQLPAELFEVLGSWEPSYYITSAVFFISFLIIISEYYIKKSRTKNRHEVEKS